MKYVFLFLLIPFIANSQIQIGNDIDGEAAEDYSSRSISLSSDGNIVAIGAWGNDGNEEFSGHVRVFENQSGIWTQVGEDIDGEEAFDTSGESVSLSSDGSIVAIGSSHNNGNGNDSGHVRVFENISGIWTQIGDDIDGEAAVDRSGISVSLSSNGSIVAIGAVHNDGSGENSGHVRVFQNSSGVWTQIGNDIDGEDAEDSSGSSLSLSSDGSIVAIGAEHNDGSSSYTGHVRIFKNISGVWTQIGDDIDGEEAFDTSGKIGSMSLSSDGSIIAIGAWGNDGNGNRSGHVRIFENISGDWTQIGDDIDGEEAEDFSGSGVSLSSDGNIVAIGAWFNDGNGEDSGHVRIYKYLSGIWTQIGNDIDGEAAFDVSGLSVSLSSDGSIIAIGAPENNGNGENSGHVRVYDLSLILSIDSLKQDYFSLYPNPVKDVLNIKINQGLELYKINIYNALGQYIRSTRKLNIITNNLKSGVYFIEVETNQGKSAKKIVVE